ncbi:MAG: hypothetical protein WA828_11545 [Coleofasciculaceae cyanobacterium]
MTRHLVSVILWFLLGMNLPQIQIVSLQTPQTSSCDTAASVH